MKSALANVKEKELSEVARRLEKSARDGNVEFIMSETPAFLHSLRALVEELASKVEKSVIEAADEDQPYLLEKLSLIKAACETYNKKNAREAIKNLQERVWSQETRELLDTISELLLHSDFGEIVVCVDRFLEKTGSAD